MTAMRKSGLFYPILLLACWTGLIGSGAYALLEVTLRQHLAESFPTTQGKVISSEVGRSIMLRRGVEIGYEYIVNGKYYTGHRYRYDDHNISLEWDLTVEDRPRGSLQTVYYNPSNPADSVLEPGIDSGDWLLLLFLAPLVILTVALWQVAIGRLREKSESGPICPVRIKRRQQETRVLLSDVSPVAAGFYGIAIAAFFAAIPVVFIGGFEPSIRVMKAAWAAVLLTGVAVFAWRASKILTGACDLRIDKSSQTITLPQVRGRRQRIILNCAEIAGVCLQRRVTNSPSGMHASYLPALAVRTANSAVKALPLISWGWKEEKARALCQWLSQELALDYKGIEQERAELVA